MTMQTFDGTNEEPELQRKPSVRQRMLSKVRGGLSVRSKSTLNIRSEPCPGEEDRKTNREWSKDMRSVSLSSVDTCIDKLEKILRSSSLSKTGMNLKSIAETSPCPNQGLHAHPSTALLTSRRVTPLHNVSPQLSLPESPVLSAHVATRSYPECLDLNSEQEVWVQLDVQAHCDVEPAATLSRHKSAIDCLVIIDNSTSVANECLESSCQLAYQIALALDVPGDKLAIYYTTRFFVATLPFRRDLLLYPFKEPDLQIVQDRLAAMQRTTNKTSAGARGDSRDVQKAFQKITGNFVKNTTERGSLSPRHAFYLSPECPKFSQQNARAAEIIFHHVSPWNDIRRMCATEEPPERVAAKLQQYTFNIQTLQPCTDLQNTIRFARMHDGFGQLQNLTVQLEPRGACEIKTTFGPMAYNSLGAGQLLSIFAQVKVPRFAAAQSARGGKCLGRDEQTGTLRKSDHLIADLEEFLGETTTELFTAHVDYGHSLFPADSEICIRKTCRVRRSVAESDWSLPLSYSQARSSQFMSQDCTDSTNVLLQSQHCRKFPISNPNDWWPATTSPERTVVSDSETGSGTGNILSNLPTGEDRLRRHAPDGASMYKQDSLNTINTEASQKDQDEDRHESHSVKSMKSMRHSSESPNGSLIQTSPDKARKIWQHMRKASRSSRRNDRSSYESLNSIGSNEVELCRIRRMALKNKRSLGTSTLWSLRQEIAGPQD
ncbi:MAG: hypothetical protein Q9165_005675 [Trypethelium subeluteriae]